MKITSLKFNTAHLSANEEALIRCQAALELKDKGDYEGARLAMGQLWQRVGERPEIGNLYPSVVAEVLLSVGVLTRWIGSKNRVEHAQEMAKNLITEGITFFEKAGDVKKVAAARVELACCYWREGAFDEARIILVEALQVLTTGGNTRARALLRLAIVEWSDSRLHEALKVLSENVGLFNKITNQTLKGSYHNQMAVLFEELAVAEKRNDYFQRALREYGWAEQYFKIAQNKSFRANVKNNVGVVFFKLSRFGEAHRHLEHARRLSTTSRDRIQTAQIDDTRAQVLIAERKFKQAETVAKGAVRVLEKSGHQCLLTDALITYGTALARLKQYERAQFTFQKAIEVAHQVGALNKAGLAALTMIEELDELALQTLYAAYDRASEWLAKSQSQDLLLRLNSAARKVFARLREELKGEEAAAGEIMNRPRDLQSEVLRYEGSLIRQALAQANGSVTRAANLLEMSYQGLAYVIGSRHKELLTERSPIRRRSRKAAAPSEPLKS